MSDTGLDAGIIIIREPGTVGSFPASNVEFWAIALCFLNVVIFAIAPEAQNDNASWNVHACLSDAGLFWTQVLLCQRVRRVS